MHIAKSCHMALFKCKNCKSSFPIHETECAYCGYKRSQLGLVLIVGLALVMLIILFDQYLKIPTPLM